MILKDIEPKLIYGILVYFNIIVFLIALLSPLILTFIIFHNMYYLFSYLITIPIMLFAVILIKTAICEMLEK